MNTLWILLCLNTYTSNFAFIYLLLSNAKIYINIWLRIHQTEIAVDKDKNAPPSRRAFTQIHTSADLSEIVAHFNEHTWCCIRPRCQVYIPSPRQHARQQTWRPLGAAVYSLSSLSLWIPGEKKEDSHVKFVRLCEKSKEYTFLPPVTSHLPTM